MISSRRCSGNGQNLKFKLKWKPFSGLSPASNAGVTNDAPRRDGEYNDAPNRVPWQLRDAGRRVLSHSRLAIFLVSYGLRPVVPKRPPIRRRTVPRLESFEHRRGHGCRVNRSAPPLKEHRRILARSHRRHPDLLESTPIDEQLKICDPQNRRGSSRNYRRALTGGRRIDQNSTPSTPSNRIDDT